MLKFAANDDRTGEVALIGLGLTHVNLARLRAGQPIAIEPPETSRLGLPDGSAIVLFAGETNRDLQGWVERVVGVELDPSIAMDGGQEEVPLERLTDGEAYLGLATTGQLLEEVLARVEVDAGVGAIAGDVADRARAAIRELRHNVRLDYRTADE